MKKGDLVALNQVKSEKEQQIKERKELQAKLKIMKTEAINDEQNYIMKQNEIEVMQKNDRIKKSELAHQRSELKKQQELMQTSN